MGTTEYTTKMRLLVVLCLVAVLGGAQAGVQETWQDLLDSLKGLGQHALDKLNEMAGHLSNATLDKLIEALQKDKQKRDLDEDWNKIIAALKAKLGDKYDELAKILAPHADKLKALLGKYGDVVKGLIEKIKEVANNLLALVGITKREVDLVARSAVKDLVDKYVEQLKELLKDMLTPAQEARLRRDLGQKITDFFKPHIDKINNLVQQIGSASKDHAANLWQNLQDSASDLKDKLSGHVDKLKEHGQTLVGRGKDAVNALKDSVTDILNSTFQNMVGTIKDAIDTGKDAINVVGEHVNGAVNGQ